jgi:hypothetical protein
MNTLKSTIDWIKPRWLRLAIGILLLIIAIQEKDNLIGFFGAFTLFQAISGKSCCGCGSVTCEIPEKKQTV